jgi:hypothetical protein
MGEKNAARTWATTRFQRRAEEGRRGDMTVLRHKLKLRRDARMWRMIFYCCWAVVLCGVAAPQAKANFVGAYSLTNFTLTSVESNGDLGNGDAITPDGGLSIVLTGGNSGSGLGGTTDLLIGAPATGQVTFTWVYTSLDTPTFDWAGYLLGGTFFQLADTNGESGTVQFQVKTGQAFGFRVETYDNIGEPGVLTVSQFDAPSVSGVPEPGSWILAVTALALGAALRGWRRRGVAGGGL